MNMPHNRGSLSSVLKSASEAILSASEIGNRRILAATRGQFLVRTSKLDLQMKPCWLLLQCGPNEENTPALDVFPLLPGNRIFPIRIELDPDFLTMLTSDRHVFGGETIVYQPDHEPNISASTIKSEESIKACLRAPKGAKVLQPVELSVFEYGSQLVIDGPEDFFLPDGPLKDDGASAKYDMFAGLPRLTSPRQNGSNEDWEETYSALLDLSTAPETPITHTTLVPTCWLPGSIGLDFQTDWHDEPGKYHTWAQVGPFRVIHEIDPSHDGCDCLKTSIRYTRG